MVIQNNLKIRLSFSGGGFRASFFCLGAFRRLVELGIWKNVSAIDSVSGGSITAGAIMQALKQGDFQDADDFDQRVTKKIKKLSQSRLRERVTLPVIVFFLLLLILSIYLTIFVFPFSIIPSIVFFVLLFVIQPRWIWGTSLKRTLDAFYNHMVLSELPLYPEWSAHSTCLNTGKRFRFKQTDFGGNLIGVTSDNMAIKLGFVVAASAAFPQVFAPLKMELGNRNFYFEWWKDTPKKNLNTPQTIYLSDGGVYDNLGSESIIRDKIPFVILDAGGYLSQWSLNLNPGWLDKTFRILNTSLDQIISLRRRLIYQKAQDINGVTLILGEPVISLLDEKKSKDFGFLSKDVTKDMPNYKLFDDEIDVLIADLRTDLDAFHDVEIDMLMWAGAVRMDIIIKKYFGSLFLNDEGMSNIPRKPEYTDALIQKILHKGKKVKLFGFLHKRLHIVNQT